MNIVRMNFKKHIILAILTFFYICSLPLQAQSLDEFFIERLSSQIQIGKETRTLLLSKHKSGKGSEVTLPNGNTVRILEYKENNYLKIQTSEIGFFALKRWIVNDHAVFGLSWWVCSSACDGHIKFVDTSTLDKGPTFPTITISDFMDKDTLVFHHIQAEDICKSIEAEFTHCEFTSSDTIWIYNNTPDILDELRAKRYKTYWKGNAIPVIFRRGEFFPKEAVIRKQQQR